MTDVLVAEGIRKSYGDATALDGVSLSAAEGEVFGLIGPNGAGKTTLVRALTGTTTPDEGTVRVLGSAPAAVEKARIGLLPQDFRPPERLTARELVAYYAGLYDEARDPERVLADVGLDGAGDTRYDELSGGQRRRVCVGTALVNDPDLLFLDEPTTGIDPAGRRALWRLFEELSATGTTIFLTTHYMAEAERLADRVGLLADGRLVEVGTPADLIGEYGGTNRLAIDLDEPFEGDLPYTFERTGEGLVVHDIEPTEIGDVVAHLERRDAAYDALVWKQPDLEDVYLGLAGEPFEVSNGEPTAPSAGLAGVER